MDDLIVTDAEVWEARAVAVAEQNISLMAELHSLQARYEAAVEALRPFAAFGEHEPVDLERDADSVIVARRYVHHEEFQRNQDYRDITWLDIRRAAAIVTQAERGQEQEATMKGTHMAHICEQCPFISDTFQGMIDHLKAQHFDNAEIKADVEWLEAHEEARYQKVWAERPAAKVGE